MPDKPLTIVKLQAEHFKRLRVVEITPSGDVVTLGGNNGQGKSSVLDAIMAVFCGEKARPDKPVHNGEEKARVTVELGAEGKVELVVSLNITEAGTSTLKISRADGGVMPKPQQYLDALTGGGFSFDPLDFARSKPNDQRETLMRLVGLDFSDLDGRRKAAFDDRTLANRQLKEAEAQLKAAPFDPSAPAQPQDAAALREEYKRASDAEADFARKEAAYKATRQRIETGKGVIADLEKKIAQMQKDLADSHKLLVDLEAQAAKEKQAAEDVEVYDLDDINRRLAEVDQVNRKVAANREHARLKELVRKHQAEAEKLTTAIEKIDAEKQTRLAKAPFPVAGLGFDDSGVTFQGVPFAQASQAEKVKVSVAMAMALNPRLRVITIREGALLDQQSRATVAAMARERGVQVWMEDVGEHADTDFILEDGNARAATQLPSSSVATMPEPATREAEPRKSKRKVEV